LNGKDRIFERQTLGAENMRRWTFAVANNGR
jgi:hypothetical protein